MLIHTERCLIAGPALYAFALILAGCETPEQTAMLGALLSGNAVYETDPQRAAALATLGSAATGYANAQASRNQVNVYQGAGAPSGAPASSVPANLVRTPNGGLNPAPGFGWLNDQPGDFRVTWQPGKSHPDHPHVRAAAREGTWTCEPGYKWVNSANNDLAVVWNPGALYPDRPHVQADAAEGRWICEPGYRWVNSVNNDLTVVWNPGAFHPQFPHVVAAQTEQQWHPAEGYKWKDGAGPGNLIVELAPNETLWRTYFDAGLAAREDNRPLDAETNLRQALAEADKIGPHDRRLAFTAANLALAQLDQKKSSEAIDSLSRALPIFERELGQESEQVCETLYWLARAHLATHNRDAAARLFTRALDVAGKLSTPPALLATCRYIAGINEMCLGHWALAVQWCDLAATDSQLPQGQRDYAALASWLGRMLLRQTVEADEHLRLYCQSRAATAERTWPAALLAYCTGALAQNDLIAKAAAGSTDLESRQRSCEAACYVAAKQYGRTDVEQARHFFQASVDTSVNEYMEFEVASFMLRHPMTAPSN